MQRKWKWVCLVPVVLLVVGITGCASPPLPFEYHEDRDEKPGPGLLSGEDGGYIIYGGSSGQKKNSGKMPTD